MGNEGPGTPKPLTQGEAGYLTQEQLDELEAGSVAEKGEQEPEAVSAEAPAEIEAAEAGPQIQEEISAAETTLAEGLNTLKAHETRLNVADSEVSREENILQSRIREEKINNAYNKVKDTVNGLAASGVVAGLAMTNLAAYFAYKASEAASNLQDGASQFTDLSDKLGQGGMAVAGATIAVAALAHSINWLSKRASRKSTQRGQMNGSAQAA